MEHDIPNELRGNENWVRNTLYSLENFNSVLIEFEQNRELSNAYGEPTGDWRVSITAPHSSGRYREFKSHGDDFEAVLYDAFTQAEKSTDEYYDQRKAAREAALAKLTPEEKRILRIA